MANGKKNLLNGVYAEDYDTVWHLSREGKMESGCFYAIFLI